MDNYIPRLQKVLTELQNGNASLARDISMQEEITNQVNWLLNNSNNWNKDQQEIADLILRISNIMYNDTSDDVLPLDDGLYDQLMVAYQKYNPNYQVGAQPIAYKENPQNEMVQEEEKVMCTYVDDNSKMYIKDIHEQNVQPLYWTRPATMVFIARDPITKRLINTTHKYPELVGTLDKCKFVLNSDARDAGVFDNPAVQIFERDYIDKCLDEGIITPTETFEMVGELKYDGVSVEADILGDTIISALSRGDTADNVATDLTPILGGYKFPFAKDVPKDMSFGIKFEAVITKRDLERLSTVRGKSYKNCRNAIIGIFSSSDAYKFIDYITLIPISTSMDMSRNDELRFLNHYYNSGQYNRHVFFTGNYMEMLYQVKQFTESADAIRTVLPYMIDGVVISFTDPNKIAKLGRVNSVNKYQMAIKFVAKKVRTIFLEYTYNIGKTGEVIPMVHFKACEFIGGIHTKQTLHSYQRFKDLNLIKGQQIDIEYRNEVITYVTKPDTEYNRNLKGIPEKFPEVCPYCGSRIEISESGKSAKCPNINCPERRIYRMIDMMDKFGFTDFSEETVRLLDIKSFRDLAVISQEQLSILGPNESRRFIQLRSQIFTTPMADYKFMAAMNFEGLGEEKWKVILANYTINEILGMDDNTLYDQLTSINGIGKKNIDIIVKYRKCYAEEIDMAIKTMNISNSKGIKTLPRIAITGTRDAELFRILSEHGFDVGEYGVTKNTYALIAKDPNENPPSTKLKKARDYGIPIYSIDEFFKINNIILQ